MVTLELNETLLNGIAPAELETRLLRTSVTRTQLLRLAMRGLHASEAAKVLGIHVSTARSHYSDPDFRRAVLAKVDGAFSDVDAAFIERTKTMTEKLEEQAHKSFDGLLKMLDPTAYGREISPNLEAKIHLEFLNRTAETSSVNRSLVSLDPMQLSVAAKAASEMDNVREMKKIA